MVRDGAVVERYSTLFDDTAEIPYGLGCGGTVDLLVEPAGTAEFEGLMEALEASLEGVESRVVTWLPERWAAVAAGCRERWRRKVGWRRGLRLRSGWWCLALETMRSRWCRWRRCWGGTLWWWMDERSGRGRSGFRRLVLVMVAEGFGELEALGIGARDAVVVMTHSYEQDRVWLAGALGCGPRYLGLLGARHRSALLVSETAALLGWSVERACEGLFAPVGLDLGGDGAEAIALAVIAEIQACCEGKLGSSRRMTAEMVAEQIARGGASRYVQAQCAL